MQLQHYEIDDSDDSLI